MAAAASKIVTQTLSDLNAALAARDIAIATAFHRKAIFVGSEPGEEAHGRDAIAALFETIFASPSSVQFVWSGIAADERDGTIWFQAQGEVVLTAASGAITRRPYRLTGVLVAGRRGLRWRLFHGSEPWLPPTSEAQP